jgi:Fe2+ or Zn2+ uptake regulation protein
MVAKDVITKQQQVVQIFEREQIAEIIDDDNHRQVLKFLFEGPLTVEDLVKAFKRAGNEKSDKSIYRYLLKLKKAGLIVEAGKRVSTDSSNQIKTQTLFARVAKIIICPFNEITSKEDHKQKTLNLTDMLLKERFGYKNTNSSRCIHKAYNKVIEAKNKTIAEIFRETENDTLLNEVDKVDLPTLFSIFDFVSWVILFKEEPQLIENVCECLF